MGIKRSKLKDHTFKKGKFITPWNAALGDKAMPSSWTRDRMPEYLWLGMILGNFDRKTGLHILAKILRKLHAIDAAIEVPSISKILSLPEEKQLLFYKEIENYAGRKALSPLTVLFSFGKHPTFARYFFDNKSTYQNKLDEINKVMKKIYGHQTHEATDIRFLIVFYIVALAKKLYLPKETITELNKYPELEHSREEMRSIRPMIRSTEMISPSIESKNEDFLKLFWEGMSTMTECKIYVVGREGHDMDQDKYITTLENIFTYLSRLFSTANPLDKKMLVLLGIATFSYKRVREIVEHNLYNTISARSTTRNLVENYIMMKYLLKHEKDKPAIWEEFQHYGLGQLKIILSKYRDAGRGNIEGTHFDPKYIELIVNEGLLEEFMDMDTSYFGNGNIRIKAAEVGEKDLYDFIYDYDSAYEHGLWGAIRESSMLACDNPSHQYHCVPDFDGKQKLLSVWQDTVFIMNKIVILLDKIYGLPKNLLEEVGGFEKQFTTKENK